MSLNNPVFFDIFPNKLDAGNKIFESLINSVTSHGQSSVSVTSYGHPPLISVTSSGHPPTNSVPSYGHRWVFIAINFEEFEMKAKIRVKHTSFYSFHQAHDIPEEQHAIKFRPWEIKVVGWGNFYILYLYFFVSNLGYLHRYRRGDRYVEKWWSLF